MLEKYLVIYPSGVLAWEEIDRSPKYDDLYQGSPALDFRRLYQIIDCSCVEKVHTFLPGIVIVVDESGNEAVDEFFSGNIALINKFLMSLAEEQIKKALEQSEKEVSDLHSRISQGMREAKKNGTKIGLSQGTTLITKKSLQCKSIIQKHCKDFGGSLEDPDVMKLCGCSRNSYYKYKRELKSKSNTK